MSSAIRWCPVSLVSQPALLTTRTNAPECGRRRGEGRNGGVMIASSMEAPPPHTPQIAATGPNKIAVSVANSTVNSSHNYETRFPHLIR